MSRNLAKTTLILSVAVLLILGLLVFRPGYLASPSGLTMLIGGELLLVAAANYRRIFLPLVFVCFLFAGTGVPFRVEFLQARWAVLALAAIIGLAVYMKTRVQSFRTFHMVALFCVLSALVSASVSVYPSEALLKALSFLLLFIYVAAGARTAIPLQAERFFLSLVTAVEILVGLTAICYFALRNAVFGNPNSLGAAMAVACVPVLLWAFLTAPSRGRRMRLGFDLTLAFLLLLSSFSRAAILAGAVSSLLVCISLREYRVLIRGTAVALLLAICAITLVPRQSNAPSTDPSESFASVFLYKGKRQQGVFGSRRSVWQQTWNVIREKPWFGSGFGTSETSADMTKLDYAASHIDSWVVREHGNSYLAIIEWTGLLGVVPFYALVLLAARNAGFIFAWARRTQDVFSPAIPAAAIVTAGLIDAMFEDWLFAVGYYVCVFFWVMAFVLVDLMPPRGPLVYSPRPVVPDQGFGIAVPTR